MVSSHVTWYKLNVESTWLACEFVISYVASKSSASTTILNRLDLLRSSYAKIELPYFNIHDSRARVSKLQKYFQFFPLYETEQVSFTSMYFNKLANHWFVLHNEQFQLISWTNFNSKVAQDSKKLDKMMLFLSLTNLKKTSTIRYYW